MEQRAAPAQHARELVVERLRIQFAGDAEARRIVQQGIDGGIGHLRDGQ